jgi:hypothetical protein
MAVVPPLQVINDIDIPPFIRLGRLVCLDIYQVES